VVETARDGHEAVTMARLSTYDAILADIRLPDLSGYEVYRQLREAQPQARVILMTGYGYDPTHAIVKARQDGLRLVLYKPFRVDQLLDALTSAPPPPPKPPAEAGAVDGRDGKDRSRPHPVPDS
jgi:CheY-like chemotaxis protein